MQVQATFAGGLAEHLQAAGGTSAAIAASLRESVSQMSSATERLNKQVGLISCTCLVRPLLIATCDAMGCREHAWVTRRIGVTHSIKVLVLTHVPSPPVLAYSMTCL